MLCRMASHLEKHWMKYVMLFSVILIALASIACSDCPKAYEAMGSKAYQHATICVSSEPGADLASDAAARWSEATNGRVDIKVRMVAGVELSTEDVEGCDANLYFSAMRPNAAGPVLGITVAGFVALDPSVITHADRLDIVAHEVGHLLLGDAYKDTGHGAEHSSDPGSIMFWLSCKGEQEITADDLGRLP